VHGRDRERERPLAGVDRAVCVEPCLAGAIVAQEIGEMSCSPVACAANNNGVFSETTAMGCLSGRCPFCDGERPERVACEHLLGDVLREQIVELAGVGGADGLLFKCSTKVVETS
jgi:hypothetical protein